MCNCAHTQCFLLANSSPFDLVLTFGRKHHKGDCLNKDNEIASRERKKNANDVDRFSNAIQQFSNNKKQFQTPYGLFCSTATLVAMLPSCVLNLSDEFFIRSSISISFSYCFSNFLAKMFAFESPHAKRNYNLSEIATKSGFKFRDITNRKLDWKTLGCVDVNKVIDNQDYEFLERIIPKLIEAPMQSILSTAILDPAVSSLFRLAQLSLQYLSFCQQFMDHTLYDLRAAFNHLQKVCGFFDFN